MKPSYKELDDKYMTLVRSVRWLLSFYIPEAIDNLWPGHVGKAMKRLKRLVNEEPKE